MHFFPDLDFGFLRRPTSFIHEVVSVSSVLKSSFTPCKLRFSALASCVALPPASLQSSARCFLDLRKKSLFLEVPPGYPSAISRSQRGFLIPLAIILIVGISFLAIAIARFSGQSATQSVLEGVSLQAFYAAESGAQYGMHQVFFSAANRAAADANCNNLSGNVLNFTVTGLNGCSSTINCVVNTDAGNTTSFYLINSFGRCGSGDIVGERVIEVSAFLQ